MSSELPHLSNKVTNNYAHITGKVTSHKKAVVFRINFNALSRFFSTMCSRAYLY